MPAPGLVDQARVVRLTRSLFRVVEGELELAAGQGNVLVCLNALACCAGVLLAGAGNAPEGRGFFDQALNQNVAEALREEELRRLKGGGG
jgi:hypothetical protein